MKTLARSLMLLAVLAITLSASAQSCALCYTQAAGAGPKFVQALKSGILVLIFPPMLICTGLFVTGYRKRNTFADTANHPRNDVNDLGW